MLERVVMTIRGRPNRIHAEPAQSDHSGDNRNRQGRLQWPLLREGLGLWFFQKYHRRWRLCLAYPAQKNGSGKFEFKAGAIPALALAQRPGKVEFPDKALIEFDVDWSTPGRNSGYFSLNVNLFTNSLKSPSNGSSYALKLSQAGANLHRQSERNGDFISDRLGSNTRVNLTGIGSRVRYSIRVIKNHDHLSCQSMESK